MPPRPYVPSAYMDTTSVYSKSRVQSVFDPRVSTVSYRPGVVDSHEIVDTDFEEDVSDLEEYSGRRSEDSVGKRSATTLSSFDELRTPDTQSNDFSGFNFQLDGSVFNPKSVQGPVGPHLFRMSTESAQELDIYLTMSPPASPEEVRAAPKPAERRPEPADANPPRTSVPLRTWTPRQVAEWMFSIGFERSIVDTFFLNDIAGVTLIDLQYDDLKELGITSFGQRHRLWSEIRSLKDEKMAGLEEDEALCFSPGVPPLPMSSSLDAYPEVPKKSCSAPDSPDEDMVTSPTSGRRRRRRRHTDNDVISPAESASIVAIEQLLPKPHSCAKGENCAKWQKRQRKLHRIATEFPAEMAQILDAAGKSSPTESGVATSVVVPSVIASSDILGHSKPSVRLEEERLRGIAARDPQDNVRQFLAFQHMNGPAPKLAETEASPYEMFPPLSPPKAQEPHANLRNLPKLSIPMGADAAEALSANRTAKPSRQVASPLAGFNFTQQPHDMWRMASPASEMDVPVTAIPLGPVERDVSSSVPPDMRYGSHGQLLPSRSSSRSGFRAQNGPPPSFHMPQQGLSPLARSSSAAGHHRRRPSLTVAPAPLAEAHDELAEAERLFRADAAAALAAQYAHYAQGSTSSPTEIEGDGDLTPTASRPDAGDHEGWMKKRRTRMLRHEWNEAHFRLRGTQLAMHGDERAEKALEYIDVDDYAVAISASASRLNSAFRRLHLHPGGRQKSLDPYAFAFQLTPAAERKGVRHAATGKTHHFAVKTANERIDWMRELMLARARKDKDVAIASFQ